MVSQLDLVPNGGSMLDGTPGVRASPPQSPSSLLLLQALNRAKQNQQHFQKQKAFGNWGRGRGRERGTMQRSSSLPSSFSSPSSPLLSPRVVSSVRIQFGRGAAVHCTPPEYSYKYTGPEEAQEEDDEDQEEEEASCVSTLLINPVSNESNSQYSAVPLPRPLPRHLTRSSYSLHSPSPPPEWVERQLVDNTSSWSTQSVPNLSSNPNQPGLSHQTLGTNQNQPTCNPGSCQMDFSNPSQVPYPMPTPYPHQNPSQFHVPHPSMNLNPSPCPTPHYPTPAPLYPSLSPFYPNPAQHFPSPTPLHPFSSVPNLSLYNPSLPHSNSLTSLHTHSNPTIPEYGNLNSQHHTMTPSMPPHSSLSSLHQPPNPTMLHQNYSHPHFPIGSPYHTPPPGSPYASPYHGCHGYNVPPHHTFPYPPSPYHRPASAPGHFLYPGFSPTPAPALNPGLPHGHFPYPGLSATPAPGCVQGSSSMETLLTRVLHEIRGTVHSLNQTSSTSGAETPSDLFSHQTAARTPQSSVAALQQKRRSLNAFRNQMMDLELSLIRQQALVYTHLSPEDRLQMEQLQSLRRAVRAELQELEFQVEERLKEQQMGFQRERSMDSLSTSSALRAMEPVSDLLREQLYLQSELDYDGETSVDHTPSVGPSSRSSSPVRASREQKSAVYRASINITPAPPPRSNVHPEEGDRGEEERDEEEEKEEEMDRKNEPLQQLIREIRESIAETVRQEIFNELLAAASPRQLPLATSVATSSADPGPELQP